MGEAKRKQYNRSQFLIDHPWCIYCGAPATTTDHCPPRCFFDRREWPETYEFPACQPCNHEARLDEQALAVLVRIPLTKAEAEPNRTEWEKLFRGVANNQPSLVAEWRNIGPSRAKRYFRSTFGPQGDALRLSGWGALNVGPESLGAMMRFVVKLGKALYYRHNGILLDGAITFKHINGLHLDRSEKAINDILGLAPIEVIPHRNNRPLNQRFIYRYNYSPQVGVIYAVVEFSPQFIFQIMAYSQEIADLGERFGGKRDCRPRWDNHPLSAVPQADRLLLMGTCR